MTLRPAARVANLERTLIRQVFDSAPPGAINLGLGQPDLATPPAAALAGIRAVCEGRTGYTATSGDLELREAVARRYPGVASGPESVLITIGSQEAMFVAFLTLVDPGTEVLIPDPGYPAYAAAARLVGASPVSYPLRAERGFRLLAEDLTSRITDATRLVVFCSPSNPTGACHGRQELVPVVRMLEARGIAWLSDEIYSAFRYGVEPVSPAAHAPRGGLVISGLSKDASMTGWRVGWAVGPPEIISRATAAHQYVVTCASSISQRAALGALSPRGDEERCAMLERFARRRDLMAEELARVGGIRYELPDGAFYFFVDVSSHGDSLAVSRRILDRRNVITIPGVAFGPGGEGHLRVSFAAKEEDIIEGVRGIAAELGAEG